MSFTTQNDTPITGQITRIGTVETPANLVREGDQNTLLLGVEAKHLTPGMIIATSEEGTYAPTMIVTEMAPAQRGEMAVRPEDLLAIEGLINHRQFSEALEALNAYKASAKNRYMPLQLKARILLESEPTDDFHDAKEALVLIREAYDGHGKSDGEVLETLARALGENGEPVSGLRDLDRLYNYALDVDSREYYQSKIVAHRRRYNIDDRWDVLDSMGDVIFSTNTENEVADKHEEEEFPADAQVRKNRIGELIDIKKFIRAIGTVKKPKSGGGSELVTVANFALGGVVVGSIVSTVTGVSLPLLIAAGIVVAAAFGFIFVKVRGSGA